jgi:hypothetical protein
LNQHWSPPLRFQASHCITFLIMCDVPLLLLLLLLLLLYHRYLLYAGCLHIYS